MSGHWIDWVVFGVYLVTVFAFGLYMSRREETSSDFFLAGRNLPWYAIALSLFASNISSGSLIALSADAYRYGVAVGTLEWGATVCLALLAFVFLPFYRRARVYTTPEFLEKRYGPTARMLFATTALAVELLVYMPFMFYAGGLFLEELFGLPFAVSIIGIALFVGIYTTVGGLSAVVWTDVIQGVLILAGCGTVTLLALNKIGGWSSFIAQVPEAHMHVGLPADHPTYPFPGTMIGGYLMVSIYYWCQNQTIVQRTLAARSEWDSRMGAIGGGYIKLLLPLVLVLPGILAVVLIPGLGMEAEADKALPKLIELVVPTGLMGLIMAALIASLMSSADSSLNSLSTIITKDFYHRWINKQATEARLILVGRIACVAVLVCTVWRAMTMAETPSLMQFLQMGLAYVAAPIIVVFLSGVFWRGATSAAAVTTLIVAPFVCLVCQNGNAWISSSWPTGVVYWLPIAVGILVTLMVVVSLMTRRKSATELEGLIWTPHYAFSLEDESDSVKGRRRLISDYRFWGVLVLVLLVAEIWWLL